MSGNAVGPNFLTLQVHDLERSRRFYTELLGLPPSTAPGPANAAVFETRPIKLAVRQATIDLDAVSEVGWGVVVWIKAEDPDLLAKQLADAGVEISRPPCDGACGREFAFVDPDGYELTIYEG